MGLLLRAKRKTKTKVEVGPSPSFAGQSVSSLTFQRTREDSDSFCPRLGLYEETMFL